MLEVTSEKGKKLLFSRAISPGEGFEFSYIHSVDKTPVTGIFLVTSGKRIKPIETQFESHGPGLPSVEGGTVFEGGKIKVKTGALEMDHFSFFVSPMTQQTLVLRGERFHFSSLREGEVVTIVVRSYPLLREVMLRYGIRSK